MQLANLKTFESGAFEMPKCGGLTDVKSKACQILVLPSTVEKVFEWFMIACLEMDSMSDNASKLQWLAAPPFWLLFIEEWARVTY